jgi:choline monooxygenase
MPVGQKIFDPRQYDKVRLPLAEAESLPAWCYTSDAFLEREVERIFLKTWIFIGRADEIPKPGDYLSTDTAGGPIILVRDRDGGIGAFANSCRHRGARLLAGKGNCRAIVCPYHSWTYGLDGALAGAPHMEQTKGFDRAHYGLTQVRLEEWQGFLFVNFDPKAEGLLDYFGDMSQKLGSHNFSDMVCVRRTEYDLASNWKLLIENAIEDYHTATVHAATLGVQNAEDIVTRGNWDSLFVPGTQSIAVLPNETAPFPLIPTLDAKARQGSYFTALFPNTQFACTMDCMWWLTFVPNGARRCKAQFGFCFPKSTVARPDFQEKAEPYFRRWDLGIAEDNGTGELQQAGLESALRQPGPLSWKESAVHNFYNWLLDRVLDPPFTARAAAE